MEGENRPHGPLKSIISRAQIRHSNTSPAVVGIGERQKKKRVAFIDRAQNAPLIQVFNYEPVEVMEEEPQVASTSCTCTIC